MTIQQFIEKAVEGGYRLTLPSLNDPLSEWDMLNGDYLDKMLLDPLAWQAVGKVEGWNESKQFVDTNCTQDNCVDERETIEQFQKDYPEIWEQIKDGEAFKKDNLNYCIVNTSPVWKIKMHRMIDALAEGKTIEQYLETL